MLTLLLASSLHLSAGSVAGAEPIKIEAQVLIEPGEGLIEWDCTLHHLARVIEFDLHQGLEPVATLGSELEELSMETVTAGAGLDPQRPIGLRRWRLIRGENATLHGIRARGHIREDLVEVGSGAGRSFSSTPGIICAEGIFLGGASAWLPIPQETLVEFKIEVSLPPRWRGVSQGVREELKIEAGRRLERWSCDRPQVEVFLIAAPFFEYHRTVGSVEAQAFLRTDDPNLASKYLEGTAQYLDMYNRLLGPYPYSKFALVENWWESGYGMPSFTLLGPQVIRLPFILRSSYPHEILHNWWGNSVYVAVEGGNWCEGLTAYLADHLIKEGEGRGWEYRRDVLKKYRSYVKEGEDFPLREFRSRHSGATEAVGYGKSLMLWHMLRRMIGDDAFIAGLQDFYRKQRFRHASFDDLADALSEASGEDLRPFVTTWVEREGAPELEMALTDYHSVGVAEHTWRVKLTQVQRDAPFPIEVPVLFDGVESTSPSQMLTARFAPGEEGEIPRSIFIELPGPPRRVDVDPLFDLFRRLDWSETPATLGDIFGASKGTIVLPVGEAGQGAWSDLATSWSSSGEWQVVAADQISEFPSTEAVWILGESNPWRQEVVERATKRGVTLEGGSWSLPGTTHDASDHAVVLVERLSSDPPRSCGWVSAALPGSIPGLARKLPHYGKYSFLAFGGEEPQNDAKGQWPVGLSPLTWSAEDSPSVPSERQLREPLARPGPVFDPARMAEVVRWLTRDELAGRGIGTEGLDVASDWVAEGFEEAGLEPGGSDGSWFQQWDEPLQTVHRRGALRLRNVIGVLPGSDPELTSQSVVVMAHVDHLGLGWPDVRQGEEGKIHPGADDNASGVAVLIETARLLATTHRPARTIIFIATSGEEWQLKGSRRYVQEQKRWPATEAIAAISIDAVGRLGSGRLLVLGTGTASEWVHIARGIGFTTGVQSTSVADDPGGSDQVAFHEIGVPAVQLTTGPHADYHRPSDTADKVDSDGLVSVATWLREALIYLGDRKEPLTSNLGEGGDQRQRPAAGSRRVFLGTVPDFADTGAGVRIEDVIADSPAAEAGLRAGDRLLTLDGKEIDGLRGYARLLRELEPGVEVVLEIEREGNHLRVRATLRAR